MISGGPKRFTVLFAGGGTGGHLMPGLSVAGELRRQYPNSRPVFAGTNKPVERYLVTHHGFEFFELPSLKLPPSALKAPAWMFRSTTGLVSAARLLRQVQPDLVVSLGGYAALAPSMAAVMGGTPVVVMEQNAVPGRANRLLAWWAREVYVPWPGTEQSFPHVERVHVTGNPVRMDLAERKNRRLAARFDLSPRKRTLLVMGGSQGAQRINEAVVNMLDRLTAEASWLQVLHSTGEPHIESVRAAYEKHDMEATVLPYIDDMASAYGFCDLALCRAGGTTLAELTALGVPAVLVPLPTAANDHQRRNADVLVREGGAVVIEQNDLRNGRLADTLIGILRDEPRLERMREAGLRMGRPAAAANVVEHLMGVMTDRAAPAGFEFAAAGERST